MNGKTLLVRHGFLQSDVERAANGEMTKTGKFLKKAIGLVNTNDKKLELVLENDWLQALNEASHQVERMGRESLIDPMKQELPLADIDPHMRGIIRWLNALGFYTVYCCDGHNTRPAYVYARNHLTMQQMNLIRACVIPGIKVRFSGKKVGFYYDQGDIHKLLDVAERLYALIEIPERIVDFEAEIFKPRLLDLLSLSGSSGNERRIRTYLQQRLQRMTDYAYVDHAGNLLAYLNCGDGPTVLLSAHMDTVEEFDAGREILEDGTSLTSSSGILGADDRAGIAVILETLSRIHKTNFNGALKIVFTVKEEIGCVGSREIDTDFIEDVDGAIVVDRRGTRDIVISNGGTSFCPTGYGEVFEKAGRLLGMDDWKTTAGGLSDAKVFAGYGIPSVNLSAGYMNEHTDWESVDYKATYETVKLIEGVLHNQMIRPQFPLMTKNSSSDNPSSL
ncbi:M20/M25/M40 family metallo-hydrolase [Halalkalibacter kiskunsagensis]|uniref:M20/M25/M40 family metallo-hydrolase n=1 Tax=Halalkalibacter kiskunsagensis TaxID=1548599 RepID=A0ABV6K7K1_9BACI